eukprot:14375_1
MSWFTYVVFVSWGVTIVYWLTRMNSALRMFDGVFIIPTLQVMWIFLSVMGGGIYFQEFNDLNTWKYVVFVIGILIIFSGVWGLAPPSTPTDEQIQRVSMHPSRMSRTQVYNLGSDDAYRCFTPSQSTRGSIQTDVMRSSVSLLDTMSPLQHIAGPSSNKPTFIRDFSSGTVTVNRKSSKPEETAVLRETAPIEIQMNDSTVPAFSFPSSGQVMTRRRDSNVSVGSTDSTRSTQSMPDTHTPSRAQNSALTTPRARKIRPKSDTGLQLFPVTPSDQHRLATINSFEPDNLNSAQGTRHARSQSEMVPNTSGLKAHGAPQSKSLTGQNSPRTTHMKRLASSIVKTPKQHLAHARGYSNMSDDHSDRKSPSANGHASENCENSDHPENQDHTANIRMSQQLGSSSELESDSPGQEQ